MRGKSAIWGITIQAQAAGLVRKQIIWNALFVGDLDILVRICRTTHFSSGPTLANAIIGADLVGRGGGTRPCPGPQSLTYPQSPAMGVACLPPPPPAQLRQQGTAETFLRQLLTDRVRCVRTRPRTSASARERRVRADGVTRAGGVRRAAPRGDAGNMSSTTEVVNVLRDNRHVAARTAFFGCVGGLTRCLGVTTRPGPWLSLAVLLLNAFTRHEGGPYLRQTLQPAMRPVLEDPVGFEIDPRLILPGEGGMPADAVPLPTWLRPADASHPVPIGRRPPIPVGARCQTLRPTDARLWRLSCGSSSACKTRPTTCPSRCAGSASRSAPSASPA